MQAFLPLLRRSAHPRIVNVSSEAASPTDMGGGTPAYTVSKVGLNALTRMLAAELRPDRILVNAICPGRLATDLGGPGGRPVEAGAAGIDRAATLADAGLTGGLFRDTRPCPGNPPAAPGNPPNAFENPDPPPAPPAPHTPDPTHDRPRRRP